MSPVTAISVSIKISTNPEELEAIEISPSDSGFQISNSIAARFGLFQRRIVLFAVFDDGREEEINVESEFQSLNNVKLIRVEVAELPSRAVSHPDRKASRSLMLLLKGMQLHSLDQVQEGRLF